MTRKNMKRLLPALLLLVPAGARAETLTLDQCVAAALKNNPEIESAGYEVQTAEIQKDAAKGGYSPRLRLEAGVQRWNEPMNSALFAGFSAFCPTCDWQLDPDKTGQTHKDMRGNDVPYYLIDRAMALRPLYTWSTSATRAASPRSTARARRCTVSTSRPRARATRRRA